MAKKIESTAPAFDRDAAIASKVAAGLTRDQAAEVVDAQTKHDAALAEAEAE